MLMSSDRCGKSIVFLLMLAIAFPAVAGMHRGDGKSVPNERHVVIFHFNDLHGRIERLARMASIVRREKDSGAEIYLLCAGDNFSGNPVVDQAEPKGEPVLGLLNALGVDCMVLGNHEFDYGQSVLRNFIRRLNFPVLCANVRVPSGDWPTLPPRIRLGKEGNIPLGILGLIQIEKESRIPSTHPSRVSGLTFVDPLEIAADVTDLRPQGGIAVVLSHLGYSADRELAERVPEIDLIVGGHSHTTLESGSLHNGVLIAQAGAHGDYLGRVDLILRDGRVVEKKARLIDLAPVQGAADMMAMVKKAENNPAMNRVLARLERRLEGKTELGNWICDILRRRLGLDVAFQNSGGVRIQRLEGEIRLKDIYQMLPFGNAIIRLQMYPGEIRNLLRYDVEHQGKVDLLVSGLKIRVVHSPDGKVAEIVLKDDAGLLDESRQYSVGFNSYIASAYRFVHADPGRSLEVTTADTLIAYLESAQPVIPADPSLRVESEIRGGGTGKVTARCEAVIESGLKPFSGSSSAGNLMADAMRTLSQSQVAFYPSRLLVPGIRIAAEQPFGHDEIRSMFRYIDKNSVRVARISGKALTDFLWERARYRRGADLQVSGMNCRIRLDAEGKVVAVDCRIMPGEEAIDAQRMYRVAFNDYDFEKYYGLTGAVAEKIQGFENLETLLLEYLRRHPRIDEAIADPRVIVLSEKRGR